jgi:hypothetical protein
MYTKRLYDIMSKDRHTKTTTVLNMVTLMAILDENLIWEM